MSNITVLITEEEIMKKCSELGEEISMSYEKGEEIYVVCVLTGGIFFTCELTKYITKPVHFEFITASSYGAEKQSSGKVDMSLNLKNDISGKNVLIIEDIIDSGRTLKKLIGLLKEKNPKSLKVCTMLDKPSKRLEECKDVVVDYTAFKVPDKFIVGYGLDDTDGTKRNLPYIATVD